MLQALPTNYRLTSPTASRRGRSCAQYACNYSLLHTLSAMASQENRQQPFPAIPPSFSAGGHEMRDYYADSDAPRPSPNQSPYLTPYLGLRARLSQVWINRWTVLLLLVLVRVLLAISSTNDTIDDAREQAFSACSAVEKAGSAMASMPHYSARGFNSLTARSIEKAVGGLQTMVELMIKGVEELIVFVIGMLTNTYLCLITLAVSGSMRSVLEVLDKAQRELDQALGSIGDEIGDVAKGLERGISSLANGVNTVFGGNNAPKIDFTGPINKMKTLKLPSGLGDDIKKLNNSIPTFQDVKNITEGVIRLPFEELRGLIKRNWDVYKFNDTLLPIPAREQLNFCTGNNRLNGFFDNMRDIAHTAKKVFLGILLTAAILACFPMAWWEIKRYQRLQVRNVIVEKHAHDKMDVAYIYSRPFTSDVGRLVARRFSDSRTKILVRWCIAYCTSFPALLLLALGFAGLFACLCQYILLRAIQKEVPAITAEIAGFGADIVVKLNNASAAWAMQSNEVITREGADLNKDLFTWVKLSTTAVNSTLNEFVDETLKTLNSTFGNTPLFEPMKDVFNCLIGLKVAGISKGLTWVHDHAHINFPLISNDTLTGGAILGKSSDSTKEFFENPEAVATEDVTRVVNKVGDKIARAIRQEAIISVMILVAWLIVFLIGLIVAIVQMKSRNRVRGDAGNEYNPNPPVPRNDTSFDRPMTPAPDYYTSNHDTNKNAPYTLNPHPIPRQNFDDNYAHDKSVGYEPGPSRTPPQNQRTFNEKSGGPF